MSVLQTSETINDVLTQTGIASTQPIHYQQTPAELSASTVSLGQGKLNDKGALIINTGEFTGRSPKDKFCVKDEITTDAVHWNDFNIAITPEVFDKMHEKVKKHLAEKELWVRDAYVCADQDYRLNVRVVNENPWSNLFAYNMFLRPTENELENFLPEWTILHAPSFHADPAVDGTRQHNFAMTNFTKKIILIGGTGYTGEMKKGIFTILNFILPHQKNVLSMHCSANVGAAGDTAVFFGLSGTGKTTLMNMAGQTIVYLILKAVAMQN
jgi:phosphoenolpyruvate carboxykinase (ATP)